jgi:hypothetical protein
LQSFSAAAEADAVVPEGSAVSERFYRKLGPSSSERLKNIEEQISWYDQILIQFDRGERLPNGNGVASLP